MYHLKNNVSTIGALRSPINVFLFFYPSDLQRKKRKHGLVVKCSDTINRLYLKKIFVPFFFSGKIHNEHGNDLEIILCFTVFW